MENDEYRVIYCQKCAHTKYDNMHYMFFPYNGYYRIHQTSNTCPKNHNHIFETNMTEDDYDILVQISRDTAFFEAMMKLKDEDIIEYESRMSQFRQQINQQKSDKSDDEAVKCPKCGSTNISTGARSVSFVFGFLGADKTVNRCAKCGYSWKPRG